MKHGALLASLLSACLAPGIVSAQGIDLLSGTPSPFDERPLPAAQAFALSSFVELPDRVVLLWDIEEGYYLYRQSLDFTPRAGGERLGEAQLPEGETLTDEFFGEVEVYRDRLLVTLPFTAGAPADLELSIQYQGCAEGRYCYPMQETLVTLELP